MILKVFWFNIRVFYFLEYYGNIKRNVCFILILIFKEMFDNMVVIEMLEGKCGMMSESWFLVFFLMK